MFIRALFAIVLTATLTAGAAPARAGALRLAVLEERFDQPLAVVAPTGDRRRAFVVEETGRIWIVRDGRRLSRPFLDLSREVSPNAARRHAGGLLGLAFAPDYRASGWFYVHYTDRDENINVQAFKRSQRTPERAAVRTRRAILRIPRASLQHAGGQLVFGPDGLLYIGIGDGGPAGDPDNHAQDLGLLLGKILRIAPSPEATVPYAVPTGNPFQATAGARPEIWAYGLRNPYRFAFGLSGELYVADPGQEHREEIDHAVAGGAAGRNYGWSCFEGTRPFHRGLTCRDAVAPVLDYATDRSRCAVVGGVVAGSGAGRLAGRFLYGDFCQGVIRTLAVRGETVVDRSTGLRVPRLTGFGEDGRHRLYATSLTGRVYRIQDVGVSAPAAARARTGAYQGLGAWIDRYDAAAWAQPETTVRALSRRGVRTLFLQTGNANLPTALPPRKRLDRFIDAARRRDLKIVAWYAPICVISAATCIGRWRRSASGPLAAIGSTPSRWISSRPAHIPSSAATGFCCGFHAAFARPSGAAIRSRRSSRRRAECSFAPGAIGRTSPSPACTATTTSSS